MQQLIDHVKYDLHPNKTATVIAIDDVEELILPYYVQGHKVIAIGNQACMNHRKLKTVTLPATLTFIGSQAFAQCNNLEKVVVHSVEIVISTAAFYGCRNLTMFDSYWTELHGSDIFWGCHELKDIMGQITGKIDRHAFAYCHKLTDIRVGDEVTVRGNAFEKCISLNRFHFEGNATLDEDFLLFVKDKQVSCNYGSNVADLAYQGISIVVEGDENGLPF